MASTITNSYIWEKYWYEVFERQLEIDAREIEMVVKVIKSLYS